MSGSDRNGTLSPDQFYAQGVLNVVRDFVQEFASRGEAGVLRRIIAGEESFRGGTVGQMPERFTEDELIRPVMEALGYTDIVSQPADLVRDQRSVPDFKTGGVAGSCVCIVEAKRFGRLDPPDKQPAVEDEIMGYLGENALTKYKRNLDRQYLMGLGTDGLVWLLYGKDLDTGEQTAIHTATLREPFRQAVLAEQFEDPTGDSWVTDQRPYVEDEFVSLLTAAAASEAVITAFQD
jgi:hypothetical protein